MWKALAVWKALTMVSLRVGCDIHVKKPRTSVSCAKRRVMENWLQMGTYFVGTSFFSMCCASERLECELQDQLLKFLLRVYQVKFHLISHLRLCFKKS